MKNWHSFYAKHKLAVAAGFALVLGSLVIWLGYILDKELSAQSIAIQVIQLILTIFATIIPTRILAQRQETQINKNRAKMALKRTITLYEQMNQVALHIENQRNFIKSESNEDKMVKESLVANSFDVISGMHKLQYGVIQDITSDWQEVIPDELAKIKESQKNSGGTYGRN